MGEQIPPVELQTKEDVLDESGKACGDIGVNDLAARQPLTPRVAPQPLQNSQLHNVADAKPPLACAHGLKVTQPVPVFEPCFVAKLLAESRTWPQMLSAVGQLTRPLD